MSLQARLNDFKERFTRGDVPFDVSQEKLESFAEARDRANQELIDSGIMEQVLGEGDQAPTFALPDTEGTIVDSDRLLQEGPLVVNFYRGVW